MREPGYLPFEERATEFQGVREFRGTRLKFYTVVYGTQPMAAFRFLGGVDLAARALPEPATGPGRPGVGFLIQHQGRTADYLVVAWWEAENELPTRVFVREGSAWRAATELESFCVWDLEILWREREAYVQTVLSDWPQGAIDRYLARDASRMPRVPFHVVHLVQWLEANGFSVPSPAPRIGIFGDGPELSRQLLDLVGSGRKTATASLLWEYDAEAESLPRPGDVEIVLAWDGRPAGVLQLTEVSVHAFGDVPADFARDEGEKDQSLASWREGHWEFFSRLCRNLGREARTDMPIVCTRFRVLHWVREDDLS